MKPPDHAEAWRNVLRGSLDPLLRGTLSELFGDGGLAGVWPVLSLGTLQIATAEIYETLRAGAYFTIEPIEAGLAINYYDRSTTKVVQEIRPPTFRVITPQDEAVQAVRTMVQRLLVA